MSEMFGQSEGALSRAAGFVEQARSDVKGQCVVLEDRVRSLMAGWGGQGAASFSTVMVAWQEKQQTILRSLDDLAVALVDTERDNVATDEAQAAANTRLLGRLG